MNSAQQRHYKRALTAAGHIRAAEKPVRILRSLSWPASTGEAFLKSGGETLPAPRYSIRDLSDSREQIISARSVLADSGDCVLAKWLLRVADKIERSVAMLQSVGTADFLVHSRALYGAPEKILIDGKTKTLNLARHLDAALDGLDYEHLAGDQRPPDMDAAAFASALEARLPKHFGDQAPIVKLDKHLSSKAAAGSRRIRIRADAQFSPMDVRQLIQHEALVHTATALNGKTQTNFAVLGASHAGTTETQEGLAVFAEVISGALDPRRFRRLADRVIAIQMTIEGADFIQVYRYFLSKDSQPRQAYEDTRRIFRGGVVTGGAPFTKDGVYLNGLLRVHNFMRTVIKLQRGDLIRLLFAGKMDIEDVPAMAYLAAHGKINAPKFMPPWARDMRFLVSYLAYSSFLNQVKLPGLQTYYTDLLAEVPQVWDFGQGEKAGGSLGR